MTIFFYGNNTNEKKWKGKFEKTKKKPKKERKISTDKMLYITWVHTSQKGV